MSSQQIPNPHHPGAPARMADGRLFTDYRANCSLLPALGNGRWADWERHQGMKRNGQVYIKADRGATVMRAASYGCVDTMVPELTKRVYSWNGPVGEFMSQPAGIGTGRSYLPGRVDLVAGDPDVLAAATFPDMIGTFSTNIATYTALPGKPPVPVSAAPARLNRYSAPYSTGN
jgi:hypothetical protein